MERNRGDADVLSEPRLVLPSRGSLIRSSVAILRSAIAFSRILVAFLRPGAAPGHRLTAPGDLRSWLLVSALIGVLLSAGCAAYRFGPQSMYPPDIETVFVPVFDSDSFREDLAERLTEATAKEIEQRTPYSLADSPDADSILIGRVLPDIKRVLIESGTDEPRMLEVYLVAQVRWITRDNQVLMERNIPIPTEVVEVGQAAPLVPEVGQSYATQSQEAIEDLAQQIVDLMEAYW